MYNEIDSFGIYLDDTHREHKISSYALSVILKDLETLDHPLAVDR